LKEVMILSCTVRIEAIRFPESCARFYSLHDVTPQKTVFFTVTLTRTQNIPKTKINIRETFVIIESEIISSQNLHT
jgi:hypothetical protein